MAGPLVLGRAGVKRALAASLLALLTGCAAPPSAAPPPSSSLSALGPSVEIAAEPVAKVVLPGEPSRLTALAMRLINRFRKAPATASAEPESPAEPERVVDEKYRFSGDDAMDLEIERGRASWYAGRFHGRPTASGEPYDKYALTAAHKTLPFGTIVRVRSLRLGREVDVRINDRGPFAPGRVIDVSQAAAEALGLTGAGVGEVSLNVAEPAGKAADASRRRSRAQSEPSPKAAKNGKNSKNSDKASEKSTKSAKSKKGSAKADAKNSSKASAKGNAKSSASAKHPAVKKH